MPCESRCVRNNRLQHWCQLFAIERNGSYGNAALKLRKFSLLKSLIEINLKQMTINSLVFRLTGSTTIASAYALSEERSNLQWNCQMTSRRKNHRASWYSWFFRENLAFGLRRELLYSNETRDHWPGGTFAALNAKEKNIMATEPNTVTHSERRFRLRKQNTNASN